MLKLSSSDLASFTSNVERNMGTRYPLSRPCLQSRLHTKFERHDTSVDVKRPVFLFGKEYHVLSSGSDGGSIPSGGTFPAEQTGCWRQLNPSGKMYLDFGDVAFWEEVSSLRLDRYSWNDSRLSLDQ